jgi:hypothetical protein
VGVGADATCPYPIGAALNFGSEPVYLSRSEATTSAAKDADPLARWQPQ